MINCFPLGITELPTEVNLLLPKSALEVGRVSQSIDTYAHCFCDYC